MKREDYDQFVATVNQANAALPGGMRFPDALIADWMASWVDDLFIGIVPQHDRLAPHEVMSAIEDIVALLEALRFTERRAGWSGAERVWFYELPYDPGLGTFPTVEWVAQYCPECDPRRGLEDRPGDSSLTTRYDQSQFFEAVTFLLGTPTDEQWAWLRRLAYRTDPMQRLWDEPPRHHAWARNQLRRCVAELAGILGVEWPEFDPSSPILELVREAHNWVVGHARPELARRGWLDRAGVGRAATQPPSDGPGAPVKLRSTLGGLLEYLEGAERNREFQRLNQHEQLRRGLVATDPSSAHLLPDESEMQGIRRIEVLCDLEPGEAGINTSKVRRLRAKICQRQRWQPQHANELTLDEAADLLEGVQRVTLDELQQASRDQLRHGLCTIDHISAGTGEWVQVTGLSCKVIAGSTPTACPDANPVLPPSLLSLAEQAIRRLYPLPEGTTVHWVGHDTGVRNRCRCHPGAPFAAPFDQARWGAVAELTNPNSTMRPLRRTNDPTAHISLRDHAGREHLVSLAACQYHGRPTCPEYLAQTPERLNDPWLAERLLAERNLELWATRDGVWFVLDGDTRETVTINGDQLSDLRPHAVVTTTTPGPGVPDAVRATPPLQREAARKTGRPLDDTKPEVVKYVRELREKKVPWKYIPDAVFQQFKVRYTSETLRGYLKNG
ncbi:hypothetical protein GobsT_49530 [Gemmata obscuriglobus]|uniref:Uncharacterized protein n=1 Tax=Gemmata obscuriglobus TaxID=114 RepID=A0A2Z3GTM0_9BACT|nr:hypothetical protein [Gemmata obscuriglobus]AWM37123.1 hypothetical protein C1280_08855 [Gemmata obscuriglobus]QEG30151.1 hypothetical protein GobsT_49530 [Gemmata obscuriglobus]VTS09472.1 unnamed protein product [Gemmata obscuriglobus UQM 2246]